MKNAATLKDGKRAETVVKIAASIAACLVCSLIFLTVLKAPFHCLGF